MKTIIAPDTIVVKEAEKIVKHILPQNILNHSKRAYYFADAYAHKKHIDFDKEGLYIAALYHDLGLIVPSKHNHLPFQMRSSLELERFLTTHNFNKTRISALVDAIDLHVTIMPKWKTGNDTALLQIGAWMDLTYRKRWTIWKEANQIEKLYPRKLISITFPFHALKTIKSCSSCLGLFHPKLYRRLKNNLQN